jgi:LEA14-like dessication related protein
MNVLFLTRTIESMIRVIPLLVLLATGITVGASVVQADEIIYSGIAPKNNEESPLEGTVEKPTIVIPNLRVESISHSWGPVSSDVTTIITQILINEPNLSLVLLSVSCNIYLNDIKMAEGRGENLTVERTSQGSLVRFTTRINTNDENIAKWWVSHIRNGEKTKAIIQGKLIMRLRKVDLLYPFSWETEFQTNMLEGVNTTDVSNFSFGLYTLQIKSLHSEWGKVTTNETEIRHRVEIYNSSKIPGAPIVNRVEYDFSLNGIKMTEGSTGLPLVIWPAETKSVIFTTKLGSKKIKTWWVSHIKSNERTSYRFRYSLLVKFFGVTLARWPKKMEGAFETDFLARKSS